MTTTIVMLAATLGMVTAPQGPEWHSDYGKALHQTRNDNRPLLMVIDRPADAEARIAPELLTSAENADELQNYDLCHIDASTEYGKKVAKVFKAEEFPYVAVIDKTGSVILHSQSGAVSYDQWNSMLTKYEKGERLLRRVVAKPVTTARQVLQQDYFQQYSPRSSCPSCQRGY